VRFCCFVHVVIAIRDMPTKRVASVSVAPSSDEGGDGSPTTNHKEADDAKEPSFEDGTTKEATEPTKEDEGPCPFCQNVPCLLEQGLYDSIAEYGESLHDNDLTSKQIRFQLYRHATTWMHGYLGKRRRLEIPQCVRTEILDIAPESNGDYVGFKEVNEVNEN
jgi:hypothetical protein